MRASYAAMWIIKRKSLIIIAGVLLGATAAGGVLAATVWGPSVDTFKVCVDEDGEARFLGFDLNDHGDGDDDGGHEGNKER